MSYYIGQIFGLLVTVSVVLSLQMKKKGQILALSIIVNLFSVGNILLLDGFNSAVLVNVLACLQILMTFWHEKKNLAVPLWEKLLFFALYMVLCVLGYHKPLDLLSFVAAAFYMLSVFQKKEQTMRLFLLGNMSTWAVYHLILRSTSFFAQLAGITSSVIALVRYRKGKKDGN